MTRWLLLALGALSALACGPVHKQIRPQATSLARLERLDVYFAKAGEFTVFDRRVDANAMEGALFGLAGAAIAEGVDADRDRKTTELVAAKLTGVPTCRPGIEQAFFETLAGSGKIRARRAEAPPTSPPADADAVVVFSIDHCGFRLMNQASGEMAAFVEVGVKLTLADGTTGWEDRETVIAPSRATVERLKSEDGLATPLLESVLADAGRRLAYNLLYP